MPQLWRMLGNIDAVHGLYYLLVHGWFAVFPATEFWSRLSSAVAVGLLRRASSCSAGGCPPAQWPSRPAWFSPCCPASPGPASGSGLCPDNGGCGVVDRVLRGRGPPQRSTVVAALRGAYVHRDALLNVFL